MNRTVAQLPLKTFLNTEAKWISGKKTGTMDAEKDRPYE
jgi:hypothetical protein